MVASLEWKRFLLLIILASWTAGCSAMVAVKLFVLLCTNYQLCILEISFSNFLGCSFVNLFFNLADLNEKINAADSDRARILNLLRGLFYWLKVSFLQFIYFLLHVIGITVILLACLFIEQSSH